MAEPQAKKQVGLTRGKAVLIGVLAVVLVGVLYMQFGPAGSNTTTSTETATESPRRLPTSAQRTTTAETEKKDAAETGKQPAAVVVDETKWKIPALADVVDYDPFALPASFPKLEQGLGTSASDAAGLVAAAAADEEKRLKDEVADLKMQLEELQQGGVHVIVRDGDQYAAMIGDRLVHVGEDIAGFTVTDIDSTGVSVERKMPE